ncbi:nitrous oxide reductase accessory protein NosL [Sinomicrobium soli]|uniref:nitrous oxide reductase accessory protein NosL n=1 Tax=Sinomicrobium sp. N-1-3-6 TaxID=2219864 RepID=UPI000DCBC397|nr:nitrous oxide reductase accessory protein NosL [Sinomicrobium sp. N-1-3-6]RAV30025.1 hypothetical protein DN748_04280 [Sinomicrobium sp. N-1-3-6]
MLSEIINIIRPFAVLCITACFSTSCEVKPAPIDYGTDNCQYCKMTIVDRQHAAQIVSDKGRVYKFDAIECMLGYQQENTSLPVSIWLINDYENPGKLIDATKAAYLISTEIPSPMGANLSGFNSEEAAKKAQAAHPGTHYDWEQLLEHFREQNRHHHRETSP